ncbi:MAG: class I SAM-dependent methyltransferase [Solirubrobacteraceae bacterium]
MRPVEVVLMIRHLEQLGGRVLELGCGAGRITGYVIGLGGEVTGLDVSPGMITECRRRYPAGRFIEGDMADLSRFADDSLDVVIVGFNVLDVFSDARRRHTLREIHRVLVTDGLLIMSSHNRAYLAQVPSPAHVRRSDPLRFALDLGRVPRRIVRHRRLRALERDEPGYAIVSDGTHDFLFVHYFITPESQFAQLGEEGFAPLSCDDLDGEPLADGDRAPACPELHYVARAK